MNKAEFIEIYKEVKRRKQLNKSTSLFHPTAIVKRGCKSCGKVNWKPDKKG